MAFSDQLIAELIYRYPLIDETRTTSYIIQTFEATKVSQVFDAVCHGDLRHHAPGVFDELITATPYSDAPSLGYIRALIDGPFQKWANLIELVEWTEGTYYLHIKDLNLIPAPVVYNFCIASRAPLEFSFIIKQWDQLVRAGVHPSVALCISSRDMYEDKMRSILAPSGGHWWYSSDHDWPSIIQGNPQGTDKVMSYSQFPGSCVPTNVIWGKGNQATLNSYVKMTVLELDQKFREELNLL